MKALTAKPAIGGHSRTAYQALQGSSHSRNKRALSRLGRIWPRGRLARGLRRMTDHSEFGQLAVLTPI
jgi:hypothetical protein